MFEVLIQPTVKGRVKARAQIKFGDLFLINGFSVIEEAGELSVLFPQIERYHTQQSLFTPLTADVLIKIEQSILRAYKKAVLC